VVNSVSGVSEGVIIHRGNINVLNSIVKALVDSVLDYNLRVTFPPSDFYYSFPTQRSGRPQRTSNCYLHTQSGFGVKHIIKFHFATS
jgi:hypothetical protein